MIVLQEIRKGLKKHSNVNINDEMRVREQACADAMENVCNAELVVCAMLSAMLILQNNVLCEIICCDEKVMELYFLKLFLLFVLFLEDIQEIICRSLSRRYFFLTIAL
ncbi:hypothetical protein HELRODRAFT_161205 [Helobdella robusta]|uniref:Uncharacterized protein n=1 Tax=Helobdella robusta TaxID=6412 RepID=T1ER75_HELRO|nr:hypothetical protein HELRODRAFT_161205 [Helobdella robusta]ESO01988.1 hypothetical protein HELRODRAFT_161205 [Helobdella robusta]